METTVPSGAAIGDASMKRIIVDADAGGYIIISPFDIGGAGVFEARTGKWVSHSSLRTKSPWLDQLTDLQGIYSIRVDCDQEQLYIRLTGCFNHRMILHYIISNLVDFFAMAERDKFTVYWREKALQKIQASICPGDNMTTLLHI